MESSKGQLYTMANRLAQYESARRRTWRASTLQRPLVGMESCEKSELLCSIKQEAEKIMGSKRRVIEAMQDSIVQSLEQDAEPTEEAHSHLEESVRVICEELGIHLERDAPWISETWFTLFRLRQAFFLMCAFAILLSLFTGLIMEIFFSIMGGAHIQFSSTFLWWKWHAIFWALPFFMMILALLGDEMCDLILDSLDSPPLHYFQSMLISAMHTKKKHPWIKLPAVKRADRITFTIFEIVPLILAMLTPFITPPTGQGTPTLFLEGYVQGSLLSAILCTFTFVISDIKVANEATGSTSPTQRMRLKWFAEKIDAQKMSPYCLHKHFDRWVAGRPAALSIEDGEHPSDIPKTQSVEEMCDHSSLNGTRALTVLFVAIWTIAVVSFTSFNKHTDWFDPMILGCALVFTVAGCSWSLHKHCPSIYGAPYVMILAFFVMVGFGLNISSAVKTQAAVESNMKSIMSVLPESVTDAEHTDLPTRWSGSVLGSDGFPQPYPVCTMAWGSPESPLRALDLANLAWIVYDPSSDDSNMRLMLHNSFPVERRAELVSARAYETLPRWGHFYFPPKGNATGGTRVVAVKGTSTVMDALVDTNLFSTVKVLQMFSQVLPVLTVLPRLVIQWLLHHVHLGTARQAEKKIWESLEADVRNLTEAFPNDTFVITGHSLGGGLAQIVAANLSLPAIVWSAPGAEYSATRFGIEVQALKRSVVSVMPDHDVVPRVDLQAGTLQLVECRKKDGSEASALQCHSLVKTACEIWRACGDERDFRNSCGPYVAKGDLGHLYAVDDSTA